MNHQRPALDDTRLRELAAGDAFDAIDAETLLASPEARARLADSDPSALFGALGPLEVEIPAMPSTEELPARRATAGSRSAWRMALGLAAASVAMACLLALTQAPLPGGPPAEPVVVEASLALPPVVERVQSPTAQIVALVPPSAGGPTVTLILDEEIDP